MNWREQPEGRFAVEFEVANNVDMSQVEAGSLSPDRVRRVRLKGVVDTGATRLVLPADVVAQLGLAQTNTVSVRYADGRQEVRPLVGNVHLELQGRSSVFNAVVEPGRTTALIGAIVLEDLDFLVDCTGTKLVPRDPKLIVSEIE